MEIVCFLHLNELTIKQLFLEPNGATKSPESSSEFHSKLLCPFFLSDKVATFVEEESSNFFVMLKLGYVPCKSFSLILENVISRSGCSKVWKISSFRLCRIQM